MRKNKHDLNIRTETRPLVSATRLHRLTYCCESETKYPV